jgi:4-amino-4-deoxy-L-arabinose transferase-like glycosyltransferase
MSAASATRAGRWLVLIPVAVMVLAAILRLPDLATRGTWDADQGHDMLVLRSLVRDGVVPLLGPPTSIGDVHHGALYYYLLAPAAYLTGGDSPLAVVALIALAGIAAVLVTWWLARSIGGPVAGLVAGLAMAVSAAAVDESTFIWNPNLIALSSSIALAGAWYGWTSGRRRGWLVAAIGTAVTMQCHVLGVTLLPVVGALLVADARRRPPGPERRAVWWVGVTGLAIIALSFLPLVVHELTNDFSETQAALDYLRAGGQPGANGPLVSFLVIAARVLSWPITGLLTDAGWVALVAVAVVIAVTVWTGRVGSLRERQAARWLGLGLLWTAFALTFLSPSLATVVPDLPNDHYHAFADPMVFTLLGMGAAVAWRIRGAAPRSLPVGPIMAAAGVVVVVAWNVAHQPPAVHPDGGFPAADAAAARIIGVVGDDPITLVSLPGFKTTEAYGYPLVRAGATVRSATGGDPDAVAEGAVVVICDSRFEVVIGAPCGGPAEATVTPADRFGQPVDRFIAAPGRTISVYRPGAVARALLP